MHKFLNRRILVDLREGQALWLWEKSRNSRNVLICWSQNCPSRDSCVRLQGPTTQRLDSRPKLYSLFRKLVSATWWDFWTMLIHAQSTQKELLSWPKTCSSQEGSEVRDEAEGSFTPISLSQGTVVTCLIMKYFIAPLNSLLTVRFCKPYFNYVCSHIRIFFLLLFSYLTY